MKSQYKLTLSRYISALILLLITQIVFYFLNKSSFNVNSFSEFMMICRGNIKFALSTLSFYLAPFFALSLIPHPFHANKIYRIITNVFYFAAVEFILLLNLIDCGYYGFTFKRITFDIFNYLGVGGDFNNLIPTFARDYWHIILIFIILNIVLYKTDAVFRKKYYKSQSDECHNNENFLKTILYYAKYTLFFVLVTVVLVVFQRGGLQKRAMGPIHASNYAATQNTALVLNTPYTFYRTIGKTSLETKNYFDQKTLTSLFSPIQSPNTNIWTDTLFNTIPQASKTNVMIIIVESFSAEYTGIYNKQTRTYTPFIDSLAEHSLVFNGMSNGKKSIDGIPAICSSMPLLNETPYITSAYGNNKLGSIASLLKPYGYQVSFFHGGYNGTMNFDGFAHQVGYTDYYGKNEYNNDNDYDGNWGIFDEPFLQYTLRKMNTMKQPFVTTLFTLSNHPPYTIPKEHTGRFPKGDVPYYETIGYTDYSLRKFFESASKTEWFQNTVFVITGDHSAMNATKEFKTQLGLYKIPMIIYSPMLKHGERINKVMQQIDILPTLADILHVKTDVFAFGRSIFSPQPHYYIYYSNGEYILMIDDYVSKYRDGFETQLYNAVTDPDMKHNIASKFAQITLKHENLTKAIIQQYNNRLIRNQTVTGK
ncbi:MAG: LTA synthase family protein [Bacteroidales bacterium]|nr:LTA synthase family protein [Bacteroidales bacterium]